MYVCVYVWGDVITFNTGQGMFIIQSYPCCGVNKQHMWRSYYLFFFCRWGRREAELCVLERQNYSWFRFILYLHIWHIFWHGSVQKYMEYIISHYVWHKWCIVQDAKICSLQSPGSAPGMSRQRWQFICLIWESDRWSHNITFFVSCVLHPASLTLYMLLSLI